MMITPKATQPKHGIPALMSFFLPGLGQLIKGNLFRALLICSWIGFGAYFGIGILLAPDGQELGILILLSIPLVYIWNLIDAYNH